MEAVWTLLELDAAGLAAEEPRTGGGVRHGEPLRVPGAVEMLLEHQAGAAVVPGGARPLAPEVLVIPLPALVLAWIPLGGVARGGAALLPPPAIHGAVMPVVSGGLARVQTQLPVHTHHLTGLCKWILTYLMTKYSEIVLLGEAVGKDLGDSVAFS